MSQPAAPVKKSRPAAAGLKVTSPDVQQQQSDVLSKLLSDVHTTMELNQVASNCKAIVEYFDTLLKLTKMNSSEDGNSKQAKSNADLLDRSIKAVSSRIETSLARLDVLQGSKAAKKAAAPTVRFALKKAKSAAPAPEAYFNPNLFDASALKQQRQLQLQVKTKQLEAIPEDKPQQQPTKPMQQVKAKMNRRKGKQAAADVPAASVVIPGPVAAVAPAASPQPIRKGRAAKKQQLEDELDAALAKVATEVATETLLEGWSTPKSRRGRKPNKDNTATDASTNTTPPNTKGGQDISTAITPSLKDYVNDLSGIILEDGIKAGLFDVKGFASRLQQHEVQAEPELHPLL